MVEEVVLHEVVEVALVDEVALVEVMEAVATEAVMALLEEEAAFEGVVVGVMLHTKVPTVDFRLRFHARPVSEIRPARAQWVHKWMQSPCCFVLLTWSGCDGSLGLVVLP